MQVISIINRKGGVGKTTTACNLAWALAHRGGKTVLLIDLDGQGNAAHLMTGEDCGRMEGAAEWMLDGGKLSDRVQLLRHEYAVKLDYGDIHVLPGGRGLFDLGDHLDSFARLKAALALHDEFYDYVVIDCPPAFDVAVLNALVASTMVIIPVTGSASSFDGARTVLHELADAGNIVGTPKIRLLQTMTTYGVSLLPQMHELEKTNPEARPLMAHISWSDRVCHAEARRELVSVFSPNCKPARQYIQLAKDIEEGKA